MTIQCELEPDVNEVELMRRLEEENRILFDQLHVVQEQLEYLHSQEKNECTAAGVPPIEKPLVDINYQAVKAENLRLEVMLRVKDELYALKTRFALASQLGEILIEGTRSTGAMLSMPGRLRTAWRKNRRTLPSPALGGKSFDKLILAYRQGGEKKVQSLLNVAGASVSVQASAWTAVARTMIPSDPAVAAVMAQRAFELEPRGFRQKWLAFRLHEAGELLKAEALLSLLPDDISLTESETRQRERLLRQSYQHRLELVDE